MVTLPLALGTPITGKVFAATAAKGGKEEKNFFDWILGNLQKEDQFYETDPILKKVQDKSGSGLGSDSGTTSGRKGGSGTVSVPGKKKNGGGFGGLFAKK